MLIHSHLGWDQLGGGGGGGSGGGGGGWKRGEGVPRPRHFSPNFGCFSFFLSFGASRLFTKTKIV